MVNKEPYCYAPWIGLNITTGSNVDYEKQNNELADQKLVERMYCK